MWISELEKIVPVLLVESACRGQDKNPFLIGNRIRGRGKVVQLVMNDRRRRVFAIGI